MIRFKNFTNTLTIFRHSYFLVILTFQCAYAQQGRILYDSIAAKVQYSYNLKEPASIYNLTSAAFQKKMTQEQFAIGMSKFYAKSGNWNTNVFKGANEKGLDYEALFEYSKQVFSIKIDEQGKISRLNFMTVPSTIIEKTYHIASTNELKDSLDVQVERLVRPYIQKGNTSGIILAVIRQSNVRKYSYGSVNKDTLQFPDAESTVFEIGSVTKTFTSLLLAQEVVAERMKLDDPINLYLPDSIPALRFQEKPVLLKHLSNHTSGFPRLPDNIFNTKVDFKDPYKYYLTDSLYSFLMRYRPSVAPGTVFSYSNYGAGLLGTILEHQLKNNFEQLIVSRVCKPLGMYHTGITLDEAAQKNFAQGHNEQGDPTPPWHLASLKGSGAIRSTLNDMVIYARAQITMDGRLKKAIALSHQPTFIGKEQSMGLGWRINNNNQNPYFYHSGGTGGFRSYVGFDPATMIGVVILSNAAEDVTEIGEAILKKLD